MASASSTKPVCIACGKATGTFTCRGCGKDFCLPHTVEHRQILNKKLEEELILSHDQLKQDIEDQMKSVLVHPLMKKIDQWEIQSIEKIRQRASESRNQLQTLINRSIEKTKTNIAGLSQELKAARQDDNFFETDLQHWVKRLDDLKTELTVPPSVTVRFSHAVGSIVTTVCVEEITHLSADWFDKTYGNTIISDGGKVLTHNGSSVYASARGRCDYLSGKHCLRFRLENISTYRWLFIGVVSKTAPTPGSGSIDATAYGFSGGDKLWQNGSSFREATGYTSEFEKEDILQLFIDCDGHLIELRNERTGNAWVLPVDPTKCPFPWKLNVGFDYMVGERIRLLA